VTTASVPPALLTTTGRYIILGVAFLGWFWAGMHMSTTQLTGQEAAIDLLTQSGQLNGARYQKLNKLAQSKETAAGMSQAEKEELIQGKVLIGRWYAWFQCAFLFGAAAGGYCFGKLGDVWGRARAMSLSILTYSVFAGAASLAQDTWQLCGLWFLACMGVGGMWPNGIALVSEVWSGMSRPALAGVIGMAANVGILLMAFINRMYPITPDSWRWVFHLGTIPIALAVVSFVLVPESPRWLATQREPAKVVETKTPRQSVFLPPLLWITFIAIVLGTIPMVGGWGTANWMIPWSMEAGGSALKSHVELTRAITGIPGSLLGGWIASQLGRRVTYFLVSVLSLLLAQYIFWFTRPTDDWFLVWVAVLGFLSGIYFGWLPLCLPELFPTQVRSTGAGVGFNFGRILTAVTLFITGAVTALFDGKYEHIGRASSLLFVLGMVCIWLAPDTSGKQLRD